MKTEAPGSAAARAINRSARDRFPSTSANTTSIWIATTTIVSFMNRIPTVERGEYTRHSSARCTDGVQAPARNVDAATRKSSAVPSMIPSRPCCDAEPPAGMVP